MAVNQDLHKPLAELVAQVERAGEATAEAVAGSLGARMAELAARLEALGASSRASGGRVEEEVATLANEVKQIREAVPRLLYRPLVALAHQTYGIRKGLGDGIGPALLERLGRIGDRVEQAVSALDRAVSPGEAGEQLRNIAREMEELRFTLSAAIHNVSPELSAKLDAMRNK